MKKLLLPGILAVFTLFLPSRSQAQPMDFPYQISITTVAFTSLVISTANFPSPSAAVNANVANYQWCVDQITVSAAGTASFTMAWSTSTLTRATTDYAVVIASGTPFQDEWSNRDPYCAPVGSPVLKLNSSVSGSTITAQGFLWKGWNP